MKPASMFTTVVAVLEPTFRNIDLILNFVIALRRYQASIDNWTCSIREALADWVSSARLDRFLMRIGRSARQDGDSGLELAVSSYPTWNLPPQMAGALRFGSTGSRFMLPCVRRASQAARRTSSDARQSRSWWLLRTLSKPKYLTNQLGPVNRPGSLADVRPRT